MIPTKNVINTPPPPGSLTSFLQSALQATAVLLYGSVLLFSFFAVPILTLYILFFTDYYYLCIIYYVWLWYDRNTGNRGGRRLEFLCRFPLCKYFADYFPVRTIKLAQLDSNKNYILGYHPHGLSGFGVIATFAYKSTGFDLLFPNMKPYVTNLTFAHYVPVLRELTQAFGACSVSEESISWLLEKEGKGCVVVIAIGGLAEMSYARPGTMKLILRKRKGFVRLAIKSGASLVPTISFGENDVFPLRKNPPGSLMRKFLDYFQCSNDTPPSSMLGRMIFSCCSWSLIPKRQPIDVIVGKPIDVIFNPNPTADEIDLYHNLYVESVKKLYDEHKENYEDYKDSFIEIL